jgi:hypothetical protein
MAFRARIGGRCDVSAGCADAVQGGTKERAVGDNHKARS